VQILFRRADGTMILRVATAEIELTSDRGEAEKGADVRVVATHAVQKAAAKAKKGDFKVSIVAPFDLHVGFFILFF
jgi:hypothetical protein